MTAPGTYKAIDFGRAPRRKPPCQHALYVSAPSVCLFTVDQHLQLHDQCRLNRRRGAIGIEPDSSMCRKLFFAISEISCS